MVPRCLNNCLSFYWIGLDTTYSSEPPKNGCRIVIDKGKYRGTLADTEIIDDRR